MNPRLLIMLLCSDNTTLYPIFFSSLPLGPCLRKSLSACLGRLFDTSLVVHQPQRRAKTYPPVKIVQIMAMDSVPSHIRVAAEAHAFFPYRKVPEVA